MPLPYITSTTEPGVRGVPAETLAGSLIANRGLGRVIFTCAAQPRTLSICHLAKYRGGIPRAPWSVSARRVIFHLLHRSGPERETDFVAAGIAGGGALERGSGASLGPDVTLDETLDETLGADEPRARAGSAAMA
jgi:hypothetical protein